MAVMPGMLPLSPKNIESFRGCVLLEVNANLYIQAKDSVPEMAAPHKQKSVV